MSQSEKTLIEVAAGTTLVRAGNPGQVLYLVESGKFVLHAGDSPAPALRRLGPGALFGETAALGSGTYLHSATAEVDSRVLPLDREAIAQLVRANPEAGVALLARLAESVESMVRLASAAGTLETPGTPSLDADEIPTMPPGADITSPGSGEPRTERPFVPQRAEAPAPIAAGVVIALTVSSGEAIILDPSLSAYLVGRPDPNAGTTPEVNLGPFDVHRSLSRRHAHILRQGDTLMLREETGVANGTFCNERRLDSGESVPIQPGDKLRFGAVEVDVVAIQTTG
ncbi:MAG TPA: cyclic nucleotide-binding domain-containing protein [Xanthomonadaceae bacterium]|nr:cyclic nucleotide-binding domain-containing protein [Xanthomonadaceae bacterium]